MKLLNFSKHKQQKYSVPPLKQGINSLSAKAVFLQRINKKKRGIKKTKYVNRKYRVTFKLVFVLILVGLVCFAAYKWLFVSDRLTITDVTITGPQRFVNIGDVKILVNSNVSGKNYFVINTSALENTLIANFLGARTVTVTKKFPHAINVLIEERVPMAIVYKNEDSYLIDGDGFVLGAIQKDFLELPRIKYDGDIKIGEFLDKAIVPVCMEILHEAEQGGLKVSSMSFSPRYTELYANNVAAYIGNDKNKRAAMETIGALIKKLGSEGKFPKKVDLRYDKVIVLYD